MEITAVAYTRLPALEYISRNTVEHFLTTIDNWQNVSKIFLSHHFTSILGTLYLLLEQLRIVLML
jgi:hypothetical protein